MEKQFAIIDKAVFDDEEEYSDYLYKYEEDFGKIENVIPRAVRYNKDLVILEVEMEKEEVI